MAETRAAKRARGSPATAPPPADLAQQLTAHLQRGDAPGAHALLAAFPHFPAALHPPAVALLALPAAARLFLPFLSDRALASLTFARGLAALAQARCELCGAPLHAPSADARTLFGVLAHAKCLEAQLQNVEALAWGERAGLEAAEAPTISREGVATKYRYHFQGMSHGCKQWGKELVSSTPWRRSYAWVTRSALLDDALTAEGLGGLSVGACAAAGQALRAREGAAAALVRTAVALAQQQQQQQQQSSGGRGED